MFKLSKVLVVLAILALAIVGCQKEPTSPLIDSKAASAIGPNATMITSATLHLFTASESTVGLNVHRVTSLWGEMTVTWNNFGGAFDATIWNSFTASSFGWVSVDVTSIAQAFAAGTYPNYGILLDKEGISQRSEFVSSESANSGHPWIEICTDDGCDTIAVYLDTYINENEPATNFGAYGLLSAVDNTTSREKQILIWFPVPVFDPPQEGCSHTIGYWKTHAGFGPQADEVTQYLPIWLGTAAGAKSRLVNTAQLAVDYLSQNVYGTPKNGITKLYAQLLGAKLSIADGADATDIAATIAAADAFLAANDYSDWNGLSKAQKALVLSWHDTLDAYNNGMIGPGHCFGE
ncbi:MAG: DNRLRE domain-containing protein [candidate division Zixibacteria bacterium]|nr:DNRLRE domain-containing protein [candidate division Zixibacteria bacterium]